MFKINHKFLFGMLLLSIFLFGCAKPECKVNSDCSPMACKTVSCVDNECSYNIIKNCCGNRLKEDIENGKSGNKCTCPEDYGECEGKVQVKVGSREYDAQYLKYLCIMW